MISSLNRLVSAEEEEGILSINDYHQKQEDRLAENRNQVNQQES